VVGPGPAGIGVLGGEERREVVRADPWVVGVLLRPGRTGGLDPGADLGELAVGELEQACCVREPAVDGSDVGNLTPGADRRCP
jgi:hypothetical protein